MERERPGALIYDQEFTELLSEVPGGLAARFVAWEEEGDQTEETTVEQLISNAHRDEDLEPPTEQGRYIILTSGTTGTPKGAQRSQPEGLSALAALLSKIPRRSDETVMIAAPALPLLGLPALHAQPAHRGDDGPAAASSTRRRP